MAEASMEDWFAINNLFIRYATALDHGDIEGVLSCFAADGVVESPVMGRFAGHAGIRDFAERNARMMKTRDAQLRHVVSNLVADVDGDTATARCYLLDYLTVDGQTELLSPGEYVCELTRSAGRWIFGRRVVLMDKGFHIAGM